MVQSTNSRVPRLYGRLATIRTGGSTSAETSTCRASPGMTLRRPGNRRTTSSRAGRQVTSVSTATTRRAPSASNARVRPPGPGPISTTSHSARLPACRAIFSGQIEIVQEVLPQVFLCPNPVLGDHLPNRWQPVMHRAVGNICRGLPPAAAPVSGLRPGCVRSRGSSRQCRKRCRDPVTS